MKIKYLTLALALAHFALLPLRGNNDIFPATGAAKKDINWKDGYFYINGKPTFLTAGEMHYSRIPREMWRDRLWRVKQMGFNCIQTYVFWNSTEPKDGVLDFSDNCDLDAWLSLIQEMGMYAIVRSGPYSCAEWDHGGFPAWLSIKPGMVLRDYDEQYLRYVDRYLAKIYAIIAKHQIHKGGNVIMTQLENECFSGGWGTEIKTPYTKHLYEKAREAGLEIPLFLSGLHHGADPSGEAPYKDEGAPWYSTEFWTGWIGKYGDMPLGMLHEKVRGTWKIIAFGGGGYGYYVVHGGTNFGYSGDGNDTTYDYSCPIGEAGQFHNLYAPARRAASFAQSFSAILTSSKNDPTFATISCNSGRVTTRKSPHGSIIFVDNFLIPADKKKGAQHIVPTADALKVERDVPKKSDITTKIKLSALGEFPKDGHFIIHANDVRTMIVNLPWTESTRFESITTNILLRENVGEVDTWVCYGLPGEYGELTIKRTKGTELPSKYSITYPKDDDVQELMIDSGENQKARFLIMNTSLADRTWFIKGKLVVGASFIREDGTAELPLEGGRVWVYDKSGKSEYTANSVTQKALPDLNNWAWRDAGRESQSKYDDSQWLSSKGVQAMETYDSYQNRYGWYRCTLKGEGKTPVSLNFMGNVGTSKVYLNGEPSDLKMLKLIEGDNSLAIFFKTEPRPKMFKFNGLVGNTAARGLWGPSLAGKKAVVEVTSWRIKKIDEKGDELTTMSQSELDDKGWNEIVFNSSKKEVELEKGSLWMRTSFQVPESLNACVAYLPKFRGHIEKKVFVNDKVLGVAKDVNQAVDLTSYLKTGINVIAIQLQVYGKPNNKTTVQPKMDLWSCNEPLHWKFRGGIEGLDETAVIGRVKNWDEFLAKPWSNEGVPAANSNTLWRTTFEYQPTHWETVGLITTGLKAGDVWLNGHNLGECPQQVPLYMPEAWLKKGSNDLVILDIWGSNPEQVKLQRYEARQLVELK